MNDDLEYGNQSKALANHWLMDDPHVTRLGAPIPFATVIRMGKYWRKMFGRPRRGRALHRAITRHRARIARGEPS